MKRLLLAFSYKYRKDMEKWTLVPKKWTLTGKKWTLKVYFPGKQRASRIKRFFISKLYMRVLAITRFLEEMQLWNFSA